MRSFWTKKQDENDLAVHTNVTANLRAVVEPLCNDGLNLTAKAVEKSPTQALNIDFLQDSIPQGKDHIVALHPPPTARSARGASSQDGYTLPISVKSP